MLLPRTALSLLIVLCCNTFAISASTGYWTIAATIENVDAGIDATTRCQMEDLELRFRSRWADGQGCITGFTGECPWGAVWGKTTTNSQGRFSMRSNLFADQGRKRDVQIEYRSQGSWLPLEIISDIDANTTHLTQGNNWIFDVGTITTDKLDCPLVLSDAPHTDPESCDVDRRQSTEF